MIRPAWACEAAERVARAGGLEVWSCDWAGDANALGNRVTESFARLRGHPFLGERLPPRLDIVLDGNWTKTSGYFEEGSEGPGGAPAIVLQPDSLLDPLDLDRLLAHEVTHAALASREEVGWVEEGLAELASFRATGRLPTSAPASYHRPLVSLTESFRVGEKGDFLENLPAYGHVFLYFLYLHRRCGGDALARALAWGEPAQEAAEESLDDPWPRGFPLDDALTGADRIDAVLEAMREVGTREGNPLGGECGGFRASFRAFELARHANNASRPAERLWSWTLRPAYRKDADFKLPPFSAGWYRAKACRKGERRIGEACLRIREE